MPDAKQILVAIDDFDRLTQPLDYVAQLVSGRDDFQIHLFHALEPLPPQLLESPGAEDPAEEEQIEQRQARQQDRWIERARQRIMPLFEIAKSRLTAAKVPRDKIKTYVEPLAHRSDLVSELVKAARDHDCGTIVVGYTDYPWIKEQFHTHISEQLMAHSDTAAICVVK